jgi:hypothetical protein
MTTQPPQLVCNFKSKNHQLIHGLVPTLVVLLIPQLTLVLSKVSLELPNNSSLTLTVLITRLPFKQILATKVFQHLLLAL